MRLTRLSTLYTVALIFLVAGVVSGTLGAFCRAASVDAGQAVGLMLDFNRLERVAFLEGESLDQVASRLLDAGVDGFIVRDRTLAELDTLGRVRVAWGWELLDEARWHGERWESPPEPLNVYVQLLDPGLGEWLFQQLDRRWPHPVDKTLLGDQEWIRIPVPTPDPPESHLPPVPLYADDYRGPYPRSLMMFPLGIEPGAVEMVRQWGALVGAEIDVRSLKPGHDDEWHQGLEVLPPLSPVIFKDGVAPARPDQVARRIRDGSWRLGLVWARTSASLQQVASRLEGTLVKVHPMWPGEPVEAIVGAAGERLERLVYYQRFVTLKPGSVATVDSGVITSVRNALAGAGYTGGLPAALHAPPVSPLLRSAAILALAGALAMALGGTARWLGWPALEKPLLFLSLVAGLGLAGLTAVRMGWPEVAWQAAALGVSILFPVIAMMLVWIVVYHWGRPGTTGTRSRPLLTGALALLMATGVTVAGGLVVQALLGTEMYTAQQLQFRGVQLSLVAPTIWLLFLLVAGRSSPGAAQIVGWLGQPVRWGHVAALAAGAVIGGLVLVRSGNFPIIPVSELELSLRAWLDVVLGVRPRTKEFLFGHPLLVVAAAALVKAGAGSSRRFGAGLWQWLLVPASIGQASVINTFAHLHTPLSISLWRTWNGIWAGFLIAALAWFVLSRIEGSRLDVKSHVPMD